MFDRYNYVVIPEKKKVVAYSSYAGQSVRGVAKCAPEDEFDVEFGKKLAAARCNVKVARKRFHRALERRDAAWERYTESEVQLMKEEDYVDDSNLALTEAEVELEAIMHDYEAAAENVQHINVSEYDGTMTDSYNDKDAASTYKRGKLCRFWKWLLNN